ncbi:aspartic endopeptidase [Aspergillus udagawae]|uniref:Aspartic endopeptidase n=1 Tax=Aspergillus udagawae TaxID=91492 RepID=A0A8H3P056_9EURO|nr:aspartic endopeptidase [Aspergillus udagawae]
MYLALVSIGMPEQTVNLDFNIGLEDLWLTNLPLGIIAQYKTRNIFDPTRSCTCKKILNVSWKFSFGDGSSASGTVLGTDTIIFVQLQAVCTLIDNRETVIALGEDVYYPPINNSEVFWLFDSASVIVNRKLITRRGHKAIADIGMMLASVDDGTCQVIYDAIPGVYYDEDS